MIIVAYKGLWKYLLGNNNVGFIDDLVKLALFVYGLWLVAGFIVWAVAMVYLWLALGYIELMVSLITSLVFFMIPFPLDLYVTWELDRLSLVGQGLLFVILVAIWLFKRSRD